MKKIVVLGANSFSGQDFIDLLLENSEYHVIGVSRSPIRPSMFLRYTLREPLTRYHFVQLDFNTDINRLLSLLDSEKPEYIVNFAAQSEVAPSWEYPEQWFQTNCVALAVLVNHLRRQSYIERYLHISTCEVYGNCMGLVTEDTCMNPTTPYAVSKASADLLLDTYCRQFSFPLLTVRSTNVYGARQQLYKIIPRTVLFRKLGRKISLHGGGVAQKSYIHIRDISRGELSVLECGEIGQIYHLSPDSAVSIRELVGRICSLGGASFEESVDIVDERPGQDAAYLLDSSKVRSALGWQPRISLNEGLLEVVDWVDKYFDDIRFQPLEYTHKK